MAVFGFIAIYFGIMVYTGCCSVVFFQQTAEIHKAYSTIKDPERSTPLECAQDCSAAQDCIALSFEYRSKSCALFWHLNGTMHEVDNAVELQESRLSIWIKHGTVENNEFVTQASKLDTATPEDDNSESESTEEDATSSATFNCPESFLNTTEGCFFLASERRSWGKAEEICREYGSNIGLARINTEKKSSLIKSVIFDHNVDAAWIGARDRDGSDVMRFFGSDEILPNNSSLWLPGQPDHLGGQDCVLIVLGGLLVYSCTAEDHYICELYI